MRSHDRQRPDHGFGRWLERQRHGHHQRQHHVDALRWEEARPARQEDPHRQAGAGGEEAGGHETRHTARRGALQLPAGRKRTGDTQTAGTQGRVHPPHARRPRHAGCDHPTRSARGAHGQGGHAGHLPTADGFRARQGLQGPAVPVAGCPAHMWPDVPRKGRPALFFFYKSYNFEYTMSW